MPAPLAGIELAPKVQITAWSPQPAGTDQAAASGDSYDGVTSRRLSLCLTERQCGELLRAVSVPVLLWRGGRHFGQGALASMVFSEEEAEELFHNSRPVTHLDEFLSHSWHDSARAKFMVLSLYYNALPASVISIAVAFFAFLLRLFGHLPVWTKVTYAGVKGAHASWSLAAGTLSFYVSLQLWHHMPAWLAGSRKRAVFFDKLCVHQGDPHLKESGIRSLAAFINHADRLLILWSPRYFRRLWCTVEVAALVRLLGAPRGGGKSRRRCSPKWLAVPFSRASIADSALVRKRLTDRLATSLVFRPLALGTLVWLAAVTMPIVYTLVSIGYVLCGEVGLPIALVAYCPSAFFFVLLVPSFHSLRRYARERHNLQAQLEEFSVQEAACFSTSDRLLIFDSIKCWFGDLEHFNSHVRTTVARLVMANIGHPASFPLRWSAIMALPTIWNAFDSLLFYDVILKSDIRMAVRRLLIEACDVLLMFQALSFSLRFASIEWVMAQRANFVQDGMITLLASFLVVLEYSILYLLKTVLLFRHAGIVPLALYTVGLLGANALLRGRCPWEPGDRVPGAAPHPGAAAPEVARRSGA
mmetsp:Transcript_92580/g.257882  ORF Transcript_92580/g.257882 Transcript_92580/m.257882 type:complete len:586 (-) Transcript_92580:19-1776(-)